MMLDDLTPGWRLLADAGWQSTLIMAIGLSIAMLLQRRHPAWAHSSLVAAAMAALLAPALAALVRGLGLGLLPAGSLAAIADPIAIATWASADGAAASSRLGWFEARGLLLLIVGAWVITSGLLLLRVHRSVAQARRLVTETRDPRPVEFERVRRAAAAAGIGRLPAVRVHESLASPAVWRTRVDRRSPRRDVLLLPEDVLVLPTPHLAAVLAHEVAHVQRGDQRHALTLALVTAILPWQPLAWVIRRRAAAAREATCDAVAAGVLGSPVRYAELLCRLVEHRRTTHAGPPARSWPADGVVVAMASGTVRTRIERLLTSPSPTTAAVPASGDRTFRVAGAASLVLAIGAATLQSARAAVPPGLPLPPPHAGPPQTEWAAPSAAREGTSAAGLLVSGDPLDLGVVGAGDVASGTLSILNPDEEPIVIETMRPTCGCITILDDVFPLILPPGGHVRIRLTMDAADEPAITKTKRLLIQVRGQDVLHVPVIVRTAPLD